jgi:hypothetical protein
MKFSTLTVGNGNQSFSRKGTEDLGQKSITLSDDFVPHFGNHED